MPKVNLRPAHRTLARTMAKRLAATELVWYISKEHEKKTYYVQEVDKKSGSVKWTLRRKNAIQFRTNGAVYQFIYKFLNNRNDVVLVNAPEED